MKIEYSFTVEEIKAMWSHYRGYTSISINNARVWYFVAPAISLTLLMLGVYAGHIWLRTQGGVLLFASLVAIPIHIAFDKWKCHRWIRNIFPEGYENEIYNFAVDEEGLIVAKPGWSKTRLTWNAITNLAQNKTITVFYLGYDCFYVPTNAMTAEQSAELNNLVARHVKEKK